MGWGSLLHKIKHIVRRLEKHSQKDEVLESVPRRIQRLSRGAEETEISVLGNEIKK